MPQLRDVFAKTLADKADYFINPPDGHLAVAIGAALLADQAPLQLASIYQRTEENLPPDHELTRIAPLFAGDQEKQAFFQRHQANQLARKPLAAATGPCYLGIDAGSTTTKLVLINQAKDLLFSHYGSNDGQPVQTVLARLQELLAQLPPGAYIANACVTGYGENLIKAAFDIKDGEVETLAHYKAAVHFCPDVDYIIDIGGQDMKCLAIQDGVISDIKINEACSSGCGSFLQSFASTLQLDVAEFAQLALTAKHPVDLGTRCTVFMNSRVKQALKEGATVGDISAGLSYSVVRNALYKVIKLKSQASLGQKIVVQGGTFLNDAVLRCFEQATGQTVVRPDIAGLMGAFGAALLAQKACRADSQPFSLPAGEFQFKSSRAICRLCANQCRLTVSHFKNSRFISGNRCEKGAGRDNKDRHNLPDLYQEKYDALLAYQSLAAEEAPRGTIGVPMVLNLLENYPFWHTALTQLGFRVVHSGRSDQQLFQMGMESIPSESVCYPAKLAHGHIMRLVDQGVSTIFYPDIVYEQKENKTADNSYNCPVVVSYPEVIKNNIFNQPGTKIAYINPFISFAHPRKIASLLVRAFQGYAVTKGEAQRAVQAAFAEQAAFKQRVRRRGSEVVAWLKDNDRQGLVLAGRPYHIDPGINHGIPKLITSLGLAVLTEDSVAGIASAPRPLRVLDQWAYHSRLYDAAAAVVQEPVLELVQLNSFGCGLDAVTSDQVQEILTAGHKTYTCLKIDEISNLGAARIRLRSLVAALAEKKQQTKPAQQVRASSRVPFTRAMQKNHTILAPQMSPIHFSLVEAALQAAGYQVRILAKASAEDIETGLKYVHNDACYPSIMVVGQIVNALLQGGYDPNNTSVFLTQTGGGCRASNYVAFLRKALHDAGLGQVPVVSINMSGLEKNPGFKLSLPLLHKALLALCLGDLLQTLVLATRPYELKKGSTNQLYQKCDQICRDWLAKKGLRQRYSQLIDQTIAAFMALPQARGERKPRVGIVGEILVKFHPDANNHLAELIEAEGCEACLPGMVDFFQYCFSNSGWRHQNLGTSSLAAFATRRAIWLVEKYRAPILARLQAASPRYDIPEHIDELGQRAEKILSLGNDSGEGWYLTAEMLQLIDNGVPNIVLVQPFACLPNHVTGKGMLAGIRQLYPQANLVAVDYDPGASEVNQLNRIKLMLAAAGRADEKKP